MKKLTLVITLAVAAFAAFAAPEKFLGWQCKDVDALKAQLAKPNDTVLAQHKIFYVYMTARLEAPESVSTLAKCEKVVGDAVGKYGSTMSTQEAVLQVMYHLKDTRFLSDMAKDSKYTTNYYYRQYYVLNGRVPASTSEKRDIALEVAERLIKKGPAKAAGSVIDKYIEFSLDDDNDTVVKGLKKLYRLVLPKLTGVTNDPWLPVSAKIALALKSRGVEVK